ncbi:MAG: hypothetical protein ACRYGR_07815 [Janthinobacterium lividum]
MSKKFLMSTAFVFALLAGKSIASDTSSFIDSDEVPSNHVATISPDVENLLSTLGKISDSNNVDEKITFKNKNLKLDIKSLVKSESDEMTLLPFANPYTFEIPDEIIDHIHSFVDKKNLKAKNLRVFGLTSKTNYLLAKKLTIHLDTSLDVDGFEPSLSPFLNPTLKSDALRDMLEQKIERGRYTRFKFRSTLELDVLNSINNFCKVKNYPLDPILKTTIEDLKKLRKTEFKKWRKINIANIKSWIKSKKAKFEEGYRIEEKYNERCRSFLKENYPNLNEQITHFTDYARIFNISDDKNGLLYTDKMNYYCHMYRYLEVELSETDLSAIHQYYINKFKLLHSKFVPKK